MRVIPTSSSGAMVYEHLAHLGEYFEFAIVFPYVILLGLFLTGLGNLPFTLINFAALSSTVFSIAYVFINASPFNNSSWKQCLLILLASIWGFIQHWLLLEYLRKEMLRRMHQSKLEKSLLTFMGRGIMVQVLVLAMAARTSGLYLIFFITAPFFSSSIWTVYVVQELESDRKANSSEETQRTLEKDFKEEGEQQHEQQNLVRTASSSSKPPAATSIIHKSPKSPKRSRTPRLKPPVLKNKNFRRAVIHHPWDLASPHLKQKSIVLEQTIFLNWFLFLFSTALKVFECIAVVYNNNSMIMYLLQHVVTIFMLILLYVQQYQYFTA